jgi:epoxyqueuosine reductase
MISTDIVKHIAESFGADFFGVADLSTAGEAILAQGGKEAASYRQAISIGLQLPHSIVDQLPHRTEISVAKVYKHHAYDVINQRLDHISSRICGFLELNGSKSFPVPASQIVDEKNLLGVFSNKMAAHLAGLGWIGKSCLLVTPSVGPRARWATVLTNASIETTGGPMEDRCGNCTDCVDICPAKAFTGRPFIAEEPRDLRFDVHKCQQYLDTLKAKMGVGTCGMCLCVCPHGKKAAAALT